MAIAESRLVILTATLASTKANPRTGRPDRGRIAFFRIT
jgi:hypothetical protein